MSQTDYSEQAVAFEGMLADLSNGMVKDTMLQGETSAEIAFGKFVVESAAMLQGALTRGTPAVAKLPAASGDDFAGGGFVIHSHDYDKRLELGTTGLKPKVQMSVLKRGRIWVHAETAMLKTDSVFVRYTVNGLLVVGDVRADDDTSKALRIYGSRVITPCLAAGLCEIEVDMAAHRAH